MKTSIAIERYLEWFTSAKNPSPHTVRAYASDLKLWLTYVASDPVTSDLSDETIIPFIRAQQNANVSSRTIIRRLAALRGLRAWLVREQLMTPDAWHLRGIGLGRQRSLPKTADSSELHALYTYLQKTLRQTPNMRADVQAQPDLSTTVLAVSLMLATGTRVSETVAIRIVQ